MENMPLRLARVFQHLSQVALAKKAGVSQALISRAERGVTTVTKAQARRIASALDIAIGRVFTRDQLQGEKRGA
jgi:transcriptional regulator with XRE-family HTH domain